MVDDLGINPEDFSDPTVRLYNRMNPCKLCPRRCQVNRTSGQIGYCGIGIKPVVSSIGPHFGEEPCLVGQTGSGTIFFSGCNLSCIFCQNYDISQQRTGSEIDVDELARAMLELQSMHCCNINLVTPTHVAGPIAAAIELARNNSLNLPIVYNCGGYDSVETLKLLEGFVDIYMPDIKYADPQVSGELSDAKDYPEIARAAVKEMHRQKGNLVIESGIAKKGLLVRHLVLPNGLAGSVEILDFLCDQISQKTHINIMDQYRPCHKTDSHPPLNRLPSDQEIRSVREYAIKKGLCILDA